MEIIFPLWSVQEMTLVVLPFFNCLRKQTNNLELNLQNKRKLTTCNMQGRAIDEKQDYL